MTLSPRESGKYIAELAKYVTINDEGVENLAKEILKGLENGNIRPNNVCDYDCYPRNLTPEETVNWILTLDTVNFCFWTPGPGKWEIHYNGKVYTGYFALCAAIAKAIDGGINMTDPAVYSELSMEELANIFRSGTKKQIPLLKERLNCLQQVGKILMEKYEGLFVNCIKAADKSAQALLKLITTEFECFNDVAMYNGKQVSFHKRAQILVADLWTHFRGEGYGEFTDINTITMFADYRVPQPLVHFNAMSYNEELMNVLKSNTILDNGCAYEVEIRGCSIEVIERVMDCVEKLMKEQDKNYLCNSILIDNYLWMYRRKFNNVLNYIPFHKVISIYY